MLRRYLMPMVCRFSEGLQDSLVGFDKVNKLSIRVSYVRICGNDKGEMMSFDVVQHTILIQVAPTCAGLSKASCYRAQKR